jgi:hypothetical protein
MMILTAMLLAAAPLPPAQLETIKLGHDIYPVAFRGTWASKASSCTGASGEADRIQIGEDRIRGFESESVILKNGGVTQGKLASGEPSYTMQALVAGSSEGEVYMVKVRLTRAGDNLYMSNPDTATEEVHLSDANRYVRCAAPKQTR